MIKETVFYSTHKRFTYFTDTDNYRPD